jgi:cytochrome c oxidase subunit 2
MIGKVIVQEYPDYQAWLRGAPRDMSPAEAGQKFFTSLACNNCHKDQDGGRGPALAGLFGTDVRLDNGSSVKMDEAFIRESILNPGAKIALGYPNIMPTFQGQVTEEQVAMIIQYIKSIGPRQNETAAPLPARPVAPAPTPVAATRPAPATAKPIAAPQGNQPKQN